MSPFCTEFTNEEMVTICPNCPALLALDDLTAVEVVKDAVVKFNRERKHLNYFTLMEVAQVTKGVMTVFLSVSYITPHVLNATFLFFCLSTPQKSAR